MIDSLEKRHLSAKCREILKNEDAIKYVIDLISREIVINVDADDAFTIAKDAIRKRAIEEGAKMVLTKLNKYASDV